MKERFDRTRKNVRLEIGSWVLVRLSDYERNLFPCRKLAPRWSSPCQIVNIKSNGVTYDVRRRNNAIEAVHITRILPLGFHAATEVIHATPTSFVRSRKGPQQEEIDFHTEDELPTFDEIVGKAFDSVDYGRARAPSLRLRHPPPSTTRSQSPIVDISESHSSDLVLQPDHRSVTTRHTIRPSPHPSLRSSDDYTEPTSSSSSRQVQVTPPQRVVSVSSDSPSLTSLERWGQVSLQSYPPSLERIVHPHSSVSSQVSSDTGPILPRHRRYRR